MMERFKLNKKLFDSGKIVELSCPNSCHNCHALFPNKLPIDVKRLCSFRFTGEYSDVELFIEGGGQLMQSHRIILGLWSAAFTKMFTDGMAESVSSKIFLRDVCYEAFDIMLDFMYNGEVTEDVAENDILLLQLLLLADQFGVSLLHQECCKRLLEHLSEDSVCQILQVLLSILSCKLIEETCKRQFAMHFDYCTTASAALSC